MCKPYVSFSYALDGVALYLPRLVSTCKTYYHISMSADI